MAKLCEQTCCIEDLRPIKACRNQAEVAQLREDQRNILVQKKVAALATERYIKKTYKQKSVFFEMFLRLMFIKPFTWAQFFIPSLLKKIGTTFNEVDVMLFQRQKRWINSVRHIKVIATLFVRKEVF